MPEFFQCYNYPLLRKGLFSSPLLNMSLENPGDGLVNCRRRQANLDNLAGGPLDDQSAQLS